MYEFSRNGLLFASPNKKISSLYKTARLVIFETLSTGFFECLAIGKPTLLFLNNNYIYFENKPAKELLNILKKLGLVHFDVESLINILKTDTTKWWISKINQKSFHDLKYKYARTSSAYIKDWVNILTDFKVG